MIAVVIPIALALLAAPLLLAFLRIPEADGSNECAPASV